MQLLGQIVQLEETVARRESRLESAARKRQQMQDNHADEIDRITREHTDEIDRITVQHSHEMHEAEKSGARITLQYRQDLHALFRCTPSEFFITGIDK